MTSWCQNAVAFGLFSQIWMYCSHLSLRFFLSHISLTKSNKWIKQPLFYLVCNSFIILNVQSCRNTGCTRETCTRTVMLIKGNVANAALQMLLLCVHKHQKRELFLLLYKRTFWVAAFKITTFYVFWSYAAAASPSHQTSPSHSSRHDLPAGPLIRSLLGSVISSCHPASWPANRHVSSYHITTRWKLLILARLFIPGFVGYRHTLRLQDHSPKKKKKKVCQMIWLGIFKETVMLPAAINTPVAMQWNAVVSRFIEWVWV